MTDFKHGGLTCRFYLTEDEWQIAFLKAQDNEHQSETASV